MALSRTLVAAAACAFGVVAFVAVGSSTSSRLGGAVARRGASMRSRSAVMAMKDRSMFNGAKNAAAGLAMAGAASLALAGTPLIPAADADISGLTKCSDSPAFHKRESKEIKSLEKQMKKAPEGSPGYLELQSRIQRTQNRFAKYGKSSLLCGPDGLPHLIVGPEFVGHEGEFAIPALGFLYINGWIGWVGRKYLRGNKEDSSKPQQGEIILDIPRLTKAMASGAAWPFEAWAEYKSGDLTAAEEDITVSAK